MKNTNIQTRTKERKQTER